VGDLNADIVALLKEGLRRAEFIWFATRNQHQQFMVSPAS
jgi:hypothetical protein